MESRLLALIRVLALSALAQFDLQDAEVVSYYPHVTDSGPVSQRWITTITLVNPHATLFARGTVYLYGQPLLLDFGSGPVSSCTSPFRRKEPWSFTPPAPPLLPLPDGPW